MVIIEDLLKEIGYHKRTSQYDPIKRLYFYKDDANVLIFNLENKTILKSGEYDGMCDAISMQELHIINIVVKRLRMELNGKEKKAIKYLENRINLLEMMYGYNVYMEEKDNFKIILNLINMLQEESNFWKEQADGYCGLTHQIQEDFWYEQQRLREENEIMNKIENDYEVDY